MIDDIEKIIPEPYSEETVELAQQVADMPPMPDDAMSIGEWAKRLAADISKGRD